jgi:hypothetical protein
MSDHQAPGGVDVIDTASLKNVKTLQTKGSIHNAYVTPDGKYVVAGSIAGKTINVFDTQKEEPAWTLDLDLGVRPMTFSTNSDGSTKWVFAQLTDFNGFEVVDFATHKEVNRIKNPDLPREERGHGRFRSLPRHGGDRGWQDAGRLQPAQQLPLFVLAPGVETDGERRAGRKGRGLGDVDA